MAGMFHQDASYDLRRGAKEMRTSIPFDAVLVDEPKVGLVYQVCAVERQRVPLVPERTLRDALEIGVDQRHQICERLIVTRTPTVQEFRNIRHVFSMIQEAIPTTTVFGRERATIMRRRWRLHAE